MNPSVKYKADFDNIFSVNDENFDSIAINLFHYQYENNLVYRQYCQALNILPHSIQEVHKIPFLPIQFFKSHQVTTTHFDPEATFESSGTTKTINSRHLVKSLGTYEKSFNECFRMFYGDPADWCIIGLLPSYLERNNSSLVFMAEKLIQQTGHPDSGFYLNEPDKLNNSLKELEQQQQKTLLIGVTFALLDFAELYPVPLKYTTIMETGGMKGRREEITRAQVHQQLCKSFGVNHIHSEYGMTELLSQAYSSGGGIFKNPPWMKVFIREEDDPFAVHGLDLNDTLNGALNIIDLANIYSCAFIATEDAGKLYKDGSFEVLGRLDNTDIRGCSLLTL